MEDSLVSASAAPLEKKGVHFVKRHALLLLGLSVLCNFLLVFILLRANVSDLPMSSFQNEDYSLLAPSVALLNAQDFLEKQQSYHFAYADLKASVVPLLTQNVQGEYGMYYEDLQTGSWMGYHEREKFIPQSLFKVPLMITVLKKVERENLALNTTVVLQKEDLSSTFGTLVQKGTGYEVSLSDLLKLLIEHSDNTAAHALVNHYVTYENYFESLATLGLPLPTNDSLTTVSPKEYSNLFRALYFSAYLRRPLSEYALSLLSNTEFNAQIPAGLPSTVKVAHKVGVNEVEGHFHDCGIVYLPEKNYLLCIMSRNSTLEESNRVMEGVSRTIYEYRLKH